jgi:hypothetical protein
VAQFGENRFSGFLVLIYDICQFLQDIWIVAVFSFVPSTWTRDFVVERWTVRREAQVASKSPRESCLHLEGVPFIPRADIGVAAVSVMGSANVSSEPTHAALPAKDFRK